jgi:hypothetical protein
MGQMYRMSMALVDTLLDLRELPGVVLFRFLIQ